MQSSITTLDEAVFGLNDAKMQIMQLIGQWIVNPDAAGTAVAIKGPMGTGKTTLVKKKKTLLYVRGLCIHAGVLFTLLYVQGLRVHAGVLFVRTRAVHPCRRFVYTAVRTRAAHPCRRFVCVR